MHVSNGEYITANEAWGLFNDEANANRYSI